MKIMAWELKKIGSDRVLWLILIVCVLIQASLLCSGWDQRSELIWWNTLIKQTGTAVTPEAVQTLRSVAEDAEQKLDAGSPALGCSDPQCAHTRLKKLDSLIVQSEQLLGQKEAFSVDSLLPNHPGESSSALEKYRDGRIRTRTAQANTEGEGAFFSLGSFLGERGQLFSQFLLLFYAGMILTAGYITVRSASLESAEGTRQIVYTSRKGRRLQIRKLSACLTAVTALYWAGAAGTVGGWLCFYPQLPYLSVPFSADPLLSGISRFPVSYLGYLLLHLVLGYGIVIVLSLLIFGLTAAGRRPLSGIAAFLAAGTGMMMTGGIVRPELALLAVNPFSLLLSFHPQEKMWRANSGDWFCYKGEALNLPGIEWISVLFWGLLAVLLCLIMLQRFQKREVS